MSNKQEGKNKWKKSWIKPGASSVAIASITTILAIILLPECKIANLGKTISEVSQQISLAIIGAMITMIAVIQAIAGTAKEGTRLEQIVKSSDFKAFKKNEYYNTVIAGILLGLSIIGEILSENNNNIVIISSIFVLVFISSLTIIRCLKHFKTLTELI